MTQTEKPAATPWKTAQMVGSFLLGRVTSDPTRRVRRLYEIPSSYLMADHSTYINYGYWSNECSTIDEASAALADLLADTAGLQPDDDILDVGFGYGDQDFTWLRERKPARIHGINIAPAQVRAANRRAEAEGVADRLDFRVGSATAIDFPAARFDRVVALESALHFYPRKDFFTEAYRVLRPGGTLATTDVLPLDNDTPRLGMRSPVLMWVELTVGDDNWYNRDVYAKELAAAGFVDIEVTSIREQVFDPWRRYILAKLEDPAFQRRMGKVYHRNLTRRWSDQELLQREMTLLDYVVARATKPAV